MPNFKSPWQFCDYQFVLLNPYHLFLLPHPIPLPSGNYQVVLCNYPSVSLCLSCSLESTCKWAHMLFVFLWLTSFSIIPSRTILAVTNDKIPLRVCTYIYHHFFIHSSTNGHLDCVHTLAIINNFAMNIWVHVLFWISVSGFFRYTTSSVRKVSSHVLWKIETFTEDTRHKKHCTEDNDVSVPFKVGTLEPHIVLSITISFPVILPWFL